ncbi:MAG: phosphopantothenoylcysteine decarboxylase [Planctomycetota bacterium]|nr:phosphopantothenoylcysteine decarboxylase [Planctomycetota bacterium]
MNHWNFTPPPPSDLGDHEVRQETSHLEGRSIALLVSGGIAAMKAPMVARALRRQGAQVTAFLSADALRYVTADTMAWSTNRPVITSLSPRAEHLSDAEHFDLYLVAPATYNTIGKCAQGIADGLLSATLASAIGRMERGGCRLLFAPTMHGSMHNSILTRNMMTLRELGVEFIAPREDAGKHNLPDEERIVWAVCSSLSTSSLSQQSILITGGPIPVPLDSVRTISNRFTGRLSIEIARELTLRGAKAHLILGSGSAPAPAWISHEIVSSLDHYSEAVLSRLDATPHAACVLSAAAADFVPESVRVGKVSSHTPWTISLSAAPKVIDRVRGRHPSLFLCGFKYEEGISVDQLLAIGQDRAARDGACVASLGNDFPVQQDGHSSHSQVSWICTRHAEPKRVEGKRSIAVAIADLLEIATTSTVGARARDAQIR